MSGPWHTIKKVSFRKCFWWQIKVAWWSVFHDFRLDSPLPVTTTWVVTHTKALEILDRLQGIIRGPWRSFYKPTSSTFTSTLFGWDPTDPAGVVRSHCVGQTRVRTTTIEGESNVQRTSLSGFDRSCLTLELQNFKAYSLHVLLQSWLTFCFSMRVSHLGAVRKEISESLSLSRSTAYLRKLFASWHFCRSLHLVEERCLVKFGTSVLCTSETMSGYRVAVKARLHNLVCWKSVSISTFQLFRRMRYNKQQRLRPRFARERLTPLETSHDNLHSDQSALYWSATGTFRNTLP